MCGWLQDRLQVEFGETRFIWDAKSFRPGVVFADYIREVIPSCTHVLALIGHDWLEQFDQKRRNKSFDYLKLELECALQSKVPVIPLLVNGARMPARSELPKKLKPLAGLHAIQLRGGADFDSDVNRIIRALKAQQSHAH